MVTYQRDNKTWLGLKGILSQCQFTHRLEKGLFKMSPHNNAIESQRRNNPLFLDEYFRNLFLSNCEHSSNKAIK